MQKTTFKVGDRVRHQFNKNLGLGSVSVIEGRRMHVFFPDSNSSFVFTTADNSLVPVDEAENDDAGSNRECERNPIERLARLKLDDLDSWKNRWEGLRLAKIREANGLGSFLGGRVRLYPHQLYVAEQATRENPVRWLLADEVGLGKTIEACLILNRLLRSQRADRVLIVVPESLTVQWLGELYRKFHQNFVLIDGARLKDVHKEFSHDFNPFDAYPRCIIALEDLVGRSDLVAHALEAPPDLLIVDEAHRLERLPGQPGNESYRTIAPICKAAAHALLLTASPMDADAHGFFRLLELLRPDEYASWKAFRDDMETGRSIRLCAGSTRREDIGGLPPRTPCPIALPHWPELDSVLAKLLSRRCSNPLERRRKAEAVERALAEPRGATDPRLTWILKNEKIWREQGHKILIFVKTRDSLISLKREIEGAALKRVSVFHEDMKPAARDIEAARFASSDGPGIMISTEAGGEGRNFEFCKAVVLFDLPWDPTVVEQRIGRLDRIGRKSPTEIIYFKHASGFAAQVAELYERLGIFTQPMGGIDKSLHRVADSIAEALQRTEPKLDVVSAANEALEAQRLANRGVYRELNANRYGPEAAQGILDRIPLELDSLYSSLILEACRQYGFSVEQKRGEDTWYIEYGNESVVDHLPGAVEGSCWLGTFNRKEATAREDLEFFSSGHPLAEGVLMELEDGIRGQVALVDIPADGMEGFGFLIFKKAESELKPIIIDVSEKPRNKWLKAVLTSVPTWREANPKEWGLIDDESKDAWGESVRRILQRHNNEIAFLAGFRFVEELD